MATATLNRRALLFGRDAVDPPALRPPWALDGPQFAARCTRCDACVEACPGQVLVRDRDGRPRFDPAQGECTFCGDCTRACGSGALDGALSPPWELRAQVAAGCLSAQGIVCASCREACPEHAIRVAPGARGPAAIDPGRCTGCGACVGICPTGAIVLARAPQEVPA
ncbi:ferredoxin-type protein NapF [Pseudoxanthomonas sp. 10H]|uniref:ferredoxin-type protein NapF n=1 Tax=Pseudoxanthomonas sp. 10H TaxID=3242729 RepID=UPI00355815D9